MLEQSPGTLTRHWNDRAAEALVTAMDELPAASRVELARRLPDTFLRDKDRQLLSEVQWTNQIVPQVALLITTGELEQALTLVQERRGRGGRALAPALEIEVLEGLKRYDEAIAMARTSRQSAAAASSPHGVVTYSLHLARLLERTGTPAQAITVLDEAIAKVCEPSTDRLRLLTAWLSLRRRLRKPRRKRIAKPDALTGKESAHRREAIDIYRLLGASEVRQVPGLLRDLAAEVGTVEPEILAEALRTVGLDATATGSVPTALAELEGNAAPESNIGTAMVADLARLDQTGDHVDWEGIVSKPRGETGHAVAEVITTFPTESAGGGLHDAVAADYQVESDAAYFDSR
jgi:hypothetical protein